MDQTHGTWNSLSCTIFNILTALRSDIIIDSISKNFINWSSNANITIVGHITAKNGKNEVRMVDVSEYVSKMIANNGNCLTFLIYRPFRHPSYRSAAGLIEADDLSNGSLIKFSSDVELVQFYN